MNFYTKYIQLCKCQNKKRIIKFFKLKNDVKMVCMHHLRKQIFLLCKVYIRFHVKCKHLTKFLIIRISELPSFVKKEFHGKFLSNCYGLQLNS